MDLDVPPDWRALGDRLETGEWRRLIVVGAADTGKSSFCQYLGRRLAGLALLDCDPGQKMVGPPACVTLGIWSEDGKLRPHRMHFIGDMQPVGHAPAVIAGIARLAATPGLGRLVVNTSGLVGGAGIPLKRAKFDALEPDLVVAVERSSELEPILAPLAPPRVQRLRPSAAAQAKRRGPRRSSREGGLAQALAGLQPMPLPDAVVEELLRAPPAPDALRLCCAAGEDGEDRAFGLVRLDRFDRERTAWIAGGPPRVHRIRVGIPVPPAVGRAVLPRGD